MRNQKRRRRKAVHRAGWTQDDEHVGVTKYGVNNYESTIKLKVKPPVRPALMGPPDLFAPLPCTALPAPTPDPEAATQLLM